MITICLSRAKALATLLAIAGICLTLLCLAQTPPTLDTERAANGVELRWRTPSGTTAGRLPSFQLQTTDDLVPAK